MRHGVATIPQAVAPCSTAGLSSAPGKLGHLAQPTRALIPPGFPMVATPTDSLFSFELKDSSLSLVTVVLKQADLPLLADDLQRRLGETPNFFDNDAVVIDIAALAESPEPLDFAELLHVLRAHRMTPAMVAGGNAAQMAAALAAGLAPAPEPTPAPRGRTVEVEVIREVRVEVPVEVQVDVPTPVPTLVIDKPLRSGQQVYAKGGDVVVLGAVNAGAEVIADGNVHVYGPLRGKAIAGSRGNADARIFTTCLEPELIAIAGVYRTTETAIPPDVAGKPAQVRLVGDKLVMEPLDTDSAARPRPPSSKTSRT
jgi:septum site-determining protein MinC